MSYSYVTYAPSAPTTLFAVPFPYVSKSHVSVKKNGVVQALTTDYTWLSPTQIQLVSSATSGDTVELRRATSPSVKSVTFVDSAKLTSTVLEADSVQDFYLSQECIDLAENNAAAATALDAKISALALATGASGGVYTEQEFTATAGQTVFTLTNPYVPGIHLVEAFINGLKQGSTEFLESSPTTITLLAGALVGQRVVVRALLPTGSVSGVSANVSYTPAGTGAVATNVQTKLRQVVNIKDKGGASTNTTAQNKTALQTAITDVNTAGGGVITIDYDCDYGFKTRTPSTWPSFTGVVYPIMVLDYSEGDTQLPSVYPTSYDGMQCRKWFFTPPTTVPNVHDGNYEWARADWNTGWCASNDSDLTGARNTYDNRRCGFATAVIGSVAWQLLQGTRTGAALTNEELSNLTIAKFAIPGDTLGDYNPWTCERKTGAVSYGGGRNIPAAYHHFEAPLAGTALDIGLFESASTTATVRLRNVNGATSSGTAGAEDAMVRNVSGSLTFALVVGDAAKFDKTTRRLTVYKALQQSKANMTYSASMTPDADAANIHQVFANNNTAFTINAPSGTNSAGQKLTIRISNTSGGALGAVTWNATYKLAAWTQPANGFSRSITFFYDDATPAWVEISRTPADVPN